MKRGRPEVRSDARRGGGRSSTPELVGFSAPPASSWFPKPQCPQSGESFVRLTKKTRSTTYIPEARNATSLSRDHNDDALLPRRRRRAWRERAAQQSTESSHWDWLALGSGWLVGVRTSRLCVPRTALRRAGRGGRRREGGRTREAARCVARGGAPRCRLVAHPTTNRARRRARG